MGVSTERETSVDLCSRLIVEGRKQISGTDDTHLPSLLSCRYALHFLVQSGLTYGLMILTGVEHMHK